MKERGEGNAFSSFGTLVHSILERYENGELKLNELADTFESEFVESVPYKFPYNRYCNLRNKYYKQGLEFLKTFRGFEGYKILGVEEKFESIIDDFVFTGIIDLIYEDNDGNLVVHDWKSKSDFKNNAEMHQYARQLYSYCIYVKEKFGRFPDICRFYMFRTQKPVDIKFSEYDFDEAIDWIKNTVKTIRECWDFQPKHDDWFCNQLCNHRKNCEAKEEK